MEPTPTKIDKHTNTEMLVCWNSGEEFKVPFVELRFLCPCAGCVDEHTGVRTIKHGSIKPDIKPTDVKVVGRYAIQISWTDGHSSGIYHFNTLREICGNAGSKL